MSKKKIIFSTLLLFAIVLPCFLSVFPINNIEINGKQNEMNLNDTSTPKSSGYVVIKLWNKTDNEEVKAVAISGNGQYMAVISDTNGQKELRFFNTSNHDGRPMWTYDATDAMSVAISKDGYYIAVATRDANKVFLFNRSLPEAGQNKKEVWVVDGFNNPDFVDISEDGVYIVIGGSTEVRVYNSSYPIGADKTTEYLWTNDTGGIVNDVAISGDGNYVVAGANADTVFFWNNTNYNIGDELAPIWSYDTESIINSIAISNGGEYIAAGCNGQDPGDELFLFNKSAKGGLPEWSDDLGGISDSVKSVAISKYGKFIAVGEAVDNDGQVLLYNSSNPTAPLWSGMTQWSVNSVDITKDGKYIVAGTLCGSNTGMDLIRKNTIFLFNCTEDNPGNELPEWVFNTTYNVNSVSISDDGRYIGAGGNYGSDWGNVFLFYHAIPYPTGLLPGAGDDDDDDDDDDTGFVVVVVVIIIIASVGGVVIVIIILIKKGIIGTSRG